MKKITLVLCALLLTAGVTKAGEYVAYQPSAPVAISWDSSDWPGEQFDTQGKAIFHTLSDGDVVKIHITNIGTGVQTYVQFKDDDWNWVDMPHVTYDVNNGVIWFKIQGETVNYTVDNIEKSLTFTGTEMANRIKERGLIIKGIYYKVLDITVQSNNVFDNGSCSQTLKDRHETTAGGWTSTEIINKDVFKNTLTSGDYITATVALTDNKYEGKALFQVKGGGNADGKGWVELKDDEGSVTIPIGGDAKPVRIEITDAELEAIKTYGLALNGTNTTVTNIVYHSHYTVKAGYRPVYIPESRYATFYGTSTCALPDGVSAYCVSSIDNDNDKAITSQLNNIPASQGVILEGAQGIYQLYTTDDAAASVSVNLLTGAVTRTLMNNVTDKYVLYNNSGTPEFRKITADTYLDPFKAYLNAAGAEARIAISFDNETNGIDELKQQTANSKQMFDLQGRRVAKSTRGLYIVNGKKVFVK